MALLQEGVDPRMRHREVTCPVDLEVLLVDPRMLKQGMKFDSHCRETTKAIPFPCGL